MIYSLPEVNKMISAYTDAPAAYSLDIGLTAEGDPLSLKSMTVIPLAAMGSIRYYTPNSSPHAGRN